MDEEATDSFKIRKPITQCIINHMTDFIQMFNYTQYREKYPENKNEVRYSVFILALKKMDQFDHVLMEKNQKIIKMKADRFLAKKKDKLIAHWEEIKMLREKGFSFRMIAKFLKIHRHFTIERTYIGKIWKELESNQK